jgi:CHAT domain-containing protein
MWLLKNSTLGESIHKIKALNDLGKISEQQHSWAAAEAYYDSALALNKKLFGKLKNRERGISYQNKALLAQQRGLTNEAVYWCNRALEELHINFAADNLKDLPDQSQNSVSPIITFEVLKLKADLFLQKYKNDSNKTNLYDAVQTYKAAFAEANYIKRTFDNDDARLFFNTNYQELYRNALGAAFEAASLDEANVDILIFLLENYKGTILSHNITLQQLKAKSSISEKDLAYEKHLKDLISIYSNRINATEVSQDEEPMRKRYVELQVELSRLQKKFENDIAFNYYRYQQGTEQLSLDKLQEKLDNNTAIVNFFCDNQFVHSICISSNRYIISKVPYDSAFRNHLGQLVNALRDQTEGKRYSGIYDSHQLFRQLLQPLRAVWDSREKIVVLPDGVLNLLPFDALSLSAKAPRYLVREKTLSYHYSYTLLTANHHPNETGQLHNATAFAPFSGKDSNIAARRLAILSSSAAELKDLTGTIAKGSQASKGFFLQQTGNSSLVHLATHAYMNDTLKNNGWIEFYPASANPDSNRLYLSEIYNLNLSKASLVVLSACETAAGLNLAGEGLLSLSRAFLYAGASSVISTLWKTEDKATAFLMSKFYEHMQQGLSKEEALRQAKCDLMDSDEVSPVLKSPNYWSNFVLVGEIKPGSQSIGQWLSYRWKWIVFIGLMLFGALYWNQVQNSRKTKDAAAEG